jgi:hypothetical protein
MRPYIPATVSTIACMLLILACDVTPGNDGKSAAQAAPAIKGKTWCTDNGCVVGEYGDYPSPQLIERAVGEMWCDSRSGVAMMPLRTEQRDGAITVVTKFAMACES